MKSCSSDGFDTWICKITRPDDYGGYIVWNVLSDRNLAIPDAWHARRSVVRLKEIGIGIKPILLENKTEKT